MTDLERRYRWLLRAYPADYRRERGAELVGTYLDLAGPGRRWPSPADATDLLRGGVRQRLRAAGADDLTPGVRLAAALALLTATTLAGIWAVGELRAPTVFGVPGFGPFVSLGVVVWAGWLLAALVLAVAPGRAARLTIGGALLLTVAVVPVAAATGLPRPPLLVLVPQAALGALALALPTRPAPLARYAPLAGAALAAATMQSMMGAGRYWGYYGWTAEAVLPPAGGLLLAVTVLLGVGLAMRQDHRGGWALLVLLTPIGLLTVHLLAGAVDGLAGAPRPTYPTLVGSSVVVALAGPLLLPLAVAARRRLAPPSWFRSTLQPGSTLQFGPTSQPGPTSQSAPTSQSDSRCPTCGRPD
ncbi:hypothetical protein AWW66_10890 [Micromonospora rosaria]|uniref:Uncharacterized protein n=1 Tax=Micromonospora rosaria TaxID=47874 RepID=A0A136PTW5_9ACTN|nr:hypothetical protein [Micromonospora rosaria]KXK61939.1 hypothetical protein AWW66_10890 [Micromonospora rosaria]